MHKIQEEMKRMFELQAWRVGGHLTPIVNDKDEIIELVGFFVDYIWFAQIFCYQKPFYIGFMKIRENRKTEQKAIIAVDETILKTLDVSDYEDSVIAALECINLATRSGTKSKIPGYMMLDIAMGGIQAHIFAEFYSEEASLRKLQDSILKTLNDLVVLYKDESLQRHMVFKY